MLEQWPRQDGATAQSCSSIPPGSSMLEHFSPVARACLGHARCSSISLPSLEHFSPVLDHFSPVARACIGGSNVFSRAFNPLFYLTRLASALVLNLLGRTFIFQQIFIHGKFLVAGKFSGGRSPELRRRRGVTGGRSRLVGSTRS